MADSLVGTHPVSQDDGAAAAVAMTLSIVDSMAAIAQEWRDLAARTPVSAYQRHEFLMAWTDHVAPAAGVSARIGLVRNGAGRVMGILPFGVSSRRGITIASYLGGSHCNLNSPLFDPAFGRSLDRPAVESLLHDYCLAAGADVLVLANQPATWCGHAHVFACLGAQASTDILARIETDANYESYADAQLSKDARSKLRRKAKKLEEAGAHLLVAQTPDEVDLVLDAYLDQKAKRLAAIGADNPFAEPGVADFLRQAALAGEGCLQLFGYVLGTEVLAVTGWLRRGEQASLMIMSFDADAHQARNSPGEVLLTRMMAGTLGQGLSRLDFGLGTERYKTTWSNASTAMFDTTFAVTAKGALYAQLRRLQTAVIRSIKQNHRLFDWLKRLRARVAGRRDDAKA